MKVKQKPNKEYQIKSRFFFYKTAPVNNQAFSGVHEHISENNETFEAMKFICENVAKKTNMPIDRIVFDRFNRL